MKHEETAHGSKEHSLLQESSDNRKRPFYKLPSSSETTDDEMIAAKNLTKKANARTASKIHLAAEHLPQTSSELLSRDSGCGEPAKNRIRGPEQLPLTSSPSTLSTKEKNYSSVLKRHEDAGVCSSNPRSSSSQLSNFKIPKRSLPEPENDSSKTFEERLIAPGIISKFKIPKRTHVAPDTGNAPSSSMSVLTSQQAGGNHAGGVSQSSLSNCVNAKRVVAELSSTSKSEVRGNFSAQGNIAGNERSIANKPKFIKQETSTPTEPFPSCGYRNGISSSSKVTDNQRTSVAWIKQEKCALNASVNSGSTAVVKVVNSGHTIRGHSKRIVKDFDSSAIISGSVTKIKQENVTQDRSSERPRPVSATDAIAAKQFGVCAKACSNSCTPKLIKQETLTETSPVCYSGNGVTSSANASCISASVTCIKREKSPQSVSLVTGSTGKPAATLGVTNEGQSKTFSEISGIHENIFVGLKKIKQEYTAGSNSFKSNSTTREVTATRVMTSSNVTGNVTNLRGVSDGETTSSASVPRCVSSNLNSTRNFMSAACGINSPGIPGHHLKRLSNIPQNHASSSKCVTLLPKVSPLIDQLKPLKGKEQRVSNLEIIEMLRQKKQSMTELVSHHKPGLPVAIVKPSPQVEAFSTRISGHPGGPPANSIASGIIDVHSGNAMEFRKAWSGSDLHGSEFPPGDLKIKREAKLEKRRDSRPMAEIKDNRDLQRSQVSVGNFAGRKRKTNTRYSCGVGHFFLRSEKGDTL